MRACVESVGETTENERERECQGRVFRNEREEKRMRQANRSEKKERSKIKSHTLVKNRWSVICVFCTCDHFGHARNRLFDIYPLLKSTRPRTDDKMPPTCDKFPTLNSSDLERRSSDKSDQSV